MIVTALASTLPEKGKSAHIVFIPEGDNTITPSVNGKAKKITVRLSSENGPSVAARFQADLDELKKKNVQPIFDFDHKNTGPSAGDPQQFYYKEGVGIMAAVDWSGSGKSAIEARDYRYFSPVFHIGRGGVPSHLPKRGPLGALVNDPAFRTIPAVAAIYASASSDQLTEPNKDMDELVQCGLLNTTEAAKDNAATIAAARVTSFRQESDKVEALNSEVKDLKKENDDLKKKVEASDAAIKKSKEDNANSLVEAAVADGRILKGDEDTQKFYRDSIISQGEPAVKALNALAVRNKGLTTQQVKAAAAKQTDNGGAHELIVQARQMVTNGEAKTEFEAIQEIAASNGELYDSYNESLTQ